MENCVIKVSKKAHSSTSITDIEQWTTAFSTYMSIFIRKFPLRSQEFLQYMSIIRYAAQSHKGLGWCIYDFKFRQKASLDKSLVWSRINQQLWLMIFTVAPSVLREEYPLFSKGSHVSVSAGAAPRGTCINFNRTGSCLREPCAFRHVCNKCRGSHLGGTVASPPTLHEADTTAKIPNPVHLVNLSTKGKHYPLSTPVNVNSLEKVIDGHPNRTLVNQLCHNLRYGACVGYTGPRVPRFCKNLPTALAQPDIVTSNLAKEVALGRIAGPYDSPPLYQLSGLPHWFGTQKTLKQI